MKAITIKQPWASLIVHGIKDIENRSWACPWKYIGHRVLIHASGKPVEMRNPNSVFTKAQWDSLPIEFQRKIICAEGIVNSAIIGSVEIIGCSINHPSKWAEKTDDSKGYYENPIYNWVLANPILYENPIEDVKGKLSFWDYPSIKEVKIECSECGSIEIAVEDYTTAPFPTYLHRCNKCEHVIIESEWKEVKL